MKLLAGEVKSPILTLGTIWVPKSKIFWMAVRNYQARISWREIEKLGDSSIFSTIVKEKSNSGLAEVAEKAFPDPKDADFVALKIQNPNSPEKNFQ